MKIPLSSFKNNKSVVREEELNPDDMELDIGVMRFPQNLLLKAEAWKSGDDLTVEVHVEGVRSFTCSLCLEEFDNVFEKDITLHYDIKGREAVTIDPDVREEVMTDHPIRILCRSDCRGLCTFCGANLNEEQCDCKGSGFE